MGISITGEWLYCLWIQRAPRLCGVFKLHIYTNWQFNSSSASQPPCYFHQTYTHTPINRRKPNKLADAGQMQMQNTHLTYTSTFPQEHVFFFLFFQQSSFGTYITSVFDLENCFTGQIHHQERRVGVCGHAVGDFELGKASSIRKLDKRGSCTGINNCSFVVSLLDLILNKYIFFL